MPEYFGYAGRVLRVNLTRGSAKTEPLEKAMMTNFLGGRGFNSARVYDEIPVNINPLSPENKLLFATGPLVGTTFPLGSRR